MLFTSVAFECITFTIFALIKLDLSYQLMKNIRCYSGFNRVIKLAQIKTQLAVQAAAIGGSTLP